MTELQNKSNQQEESIDLKAIFLTYSYYWYYFIISILFCLFIAFLYCRYSKPIYSVSSTLLIRDDNNSQLGAENLLEGLEIFSGSTNLENEIALINSYTITKQAIEDLGFGISYFKHGTIQKSEVDDMDIITSGSTPPNPAELLDNPRMGQLIKDLQKEYVYIVIDTPPIGLVTDGVSLMKFADINLFVVRHMYSKKKMLSIVNNLFENKRVNNLNIIINDYEYSQSVYDYGYGYGYGGDGYGYYEEDEKS